MNVGQIGELIKGIVTYFIPIASFILSIYSIYRSSKVSALEQKVNEYDLKLKLLFCKWVVSDKLLQAVL